MVSPGLLQNWVGASIAPNLELFPCRGLRGLPRACHNVRVFDAFRTVSELEFDVRTLGPGLPVNAASEVVRIGSPVSIRGLSPNPVQHEVDGVEKGRLPPSIEPTKENHGLLVGDRRKVDDLLSPVKSEVKEGDAIENHGVPPSSTSTDPVATVSKLSWAEVSTRVPCGSAHNASRAFCCRRARSRASSSFS